MTNRMTHDDSYIEQIVDEAYITLEIMAYFNRGHYPRLELTMTRFIKTIQSYYNIELHADIEKLTFFTRNRPSDNEINLAITALKNYNVDASAFKRRTIERTKHFDCWDIEDVDTIVLIRPGDTVTLLKELQSILIGLKNAGYIHLPQAFSDKPERY